MPFPDKRLFEMFAKGGVSTFIETGTFHGSGVRAAVACGFARVHSIEPVRQFYDECSGKLAPLIASGKVTLHLGTSEAVLPNLLASIDGPVCFWLDAHFQGAESELKAKNCPLVDEVAAILSRRNPMDGIFIDDIRLLKNPQAWRGHDVDLEKLIGRILMGYRDHFGCFVASNPAKPVLANDVFCVIPKSRLPEVAAVLSDGPAMRMQA